MISRVRILILFMLAVCFIPSICLGQKTKEELQKENDKIKKEIAFADKLLKETKKNRKVSLNQLYLISKKIKNRERLISNINRQIQDIDQNIDANKSKIKSLSKEQESLKEEYAQMIYFAWKNKSIWNKWMFILAAEDFNEAYQRMRYYQQYSAFRKKQSELIKKNSNDINNEIEILNKKKTEKQSLIISQNQEKHNLISEKNSQGKVVSEINQKKKELEKELKEKQKQARKIYKKIEKLIAAELKAKEKRAKKLKANNKPVDASTKLTLKELKLNKEFIANKGKLPWPVAKGFIASSYGIHTHEKEKRVQDEQKGIRFITNKGQDARSVFNGIVTTVYPMFDYDIIVIISHGEYITVYHNLSNVYVKKDDIVKTGQPIGKIFTDPINGKTEMEFLIYKDKQKKYLNPKYWIRK
ncbi:MAG: murein hydrolase activator EnvC [Bacteroidales bacterium]